MRLLVIFDSQPRQWQTFAMSSYLDDPEARARYCGARFAAAFNPLVDELKLTPTEADLALASILAVSVARNTRRGDRQRDARRLCEIILSLADQFAEAARTGSLQRLH
jgi:hypothetical protein